MGILRLASSDNVVMTYDKVLHKTDKSVLLEHDGGCESWIPFSQFEDPAEADALEKGDEDGAVTITEWIAKKKGLI